MLYEKVKPFIDYSIIIFVPIIFIFVKDLKPMEYIPLSIVFLLSLFDIITRIKKKKNKKEENGSVK